MLLVETELEETFFRGVPLVVPGFNQHEAPLQLDLAKCVGDLLVLLDGDIDGLLLRGFVDFEPLRGWGDFGAEIYLGRVINLVPSHAVLFVYDDGDLAGRKGEKVS